MYTTVLDRLLYSIATFCTEILLPLKMLPIDGDPSIVIIVYRYRLIAGF